MAVPKPRSLPTRRSFFEWLPTRSAKALHSCSSIDFEVANVLHQCQGLIAQLFFNVPSTSQRLAPSFLRINEHHGVYFGALHSKGSIAKRKENAEQMKDTQHFTSEHNSTDQRPQYLLLCLALLRRPRPRLERRKTRVANLSERHQR